MREKSLAERTWSAFLEGLGQYEADPSEFRRARDLLLAMAVCLYLFMLVSLLTVRPHPLESLGVTHETLKFVSVGTLVLVLAIGIYVTVHLEKFRIRRRPRSVRTFRPNAILAGLLFAGGVTYSMLQLEVWTFTVFMIAWVGLLTYAQIRYMKFHPKPPLMEHRADDVQHSDI